MVKKENLKILFYLAAVAIISVGLSVSIQSLLAAWTAPTALPPSGNVEAPINASSITQVKSGVLGVTNDFYVGGVNTFFVDGLGTGNVGIGTNSPQKKLEVKDGDVYINKTDGKLIIKSPDGTCSSCGPDNSDAWSCSSISCP